MDLFSLSIVLALAGPPQAPADCTPPHARTSYLDHPGEDSLLKIERVPATVLPRRSSAKKSPGGGSYSLWMGKNNSSLIGTRSGHALRLSVPEFAWRPLETRWINGKLVYVEVSFNPQAGAYWIVDVETEAIVTWQSWLEDPGPDCPPG